MRGQTECVFARGTRLWGAEAWEPGAFAHNLDRFAARLTRFAAVADVQRLDGIVLEIAEPGAGATVERLAATTRAVVEGLTARDPAPAPGPLVDDPRWWLTFGGSALFVATFAPCYDATSSRYGFGLEHTYLLFQTCASFVRRHAPGSGVLPESARIRMTDEQLVDHKLANGPWKFDVSTTEVFDNMLERSIPQYDVMRATVDEIALKFAAAARGSRCIVDLGCSRGEAIARLVAALDSDTRFVGVDTSAPMLAAARKRFAGDSNVSLLDLDLRLAYPEVRANVTLGVLTLQFVPIEHRQRLIQEVYDHTEPGGTFIIVEKVLGATAELDRLMVASYLAMKRRNGYTQEEVDRKRLSLEGVLVPVTAKWNVEMLRAAGFQQVDCFWRWMNFGGWVAMRQ